MNQYDPKFLAERALQWRAEAQEATLEAMRVFCLREALWCERRVHMGLHTPAILEPSASARIERAGAARSARITG